MPRKLFDLSHVVEHGLVTYPGLPSPVVSDHLGREASRNVYAAGTTFHIGRIDMVGNTGTYVDAPFHRYADGADLAGLPLESLADLPVVLVRRPHANGRAIDVDRLRGHDVMNKAVLLHTGWDVHFATDRYGEGAPFLTRAAAELLAEGRAALVGIDSLNIDDKADPARPSHSILLAAGIPIVEHLTNLGSLPDVALRFFAVPAKVRSFGSFPVRAFAIAG